MVISNRARERTLFSDQHLHSWLPLEHTERGGGGATAAVGVASAAVGVASATVGVASATVETPHETLGRRALDESADVHSRAEAARVSE